MPEDLHIAPPPDRSPLLAVVIALVVLAVVAVAVFLLNPRKVADASATVQLFAPHTQFTEQRGAAGTHVLGIGPQAEDDLYVIANVHVANHLRLPIFVSASTVTVTSPDNSQLQADAVATSQLPRLEQIFPQLAPMLPNPLVDGAKADPKGTLDGQVLVLFPSANQDFWKNKKSAVLTLTLAHQEPLTVPLN